MDGKIAEVLIYNDELDAAELDQVGSYLAAKYLIGTLYTPTTCAVLLLNEDAHDPMDLYPDCQIDYLDFSSFAQVWGLNFDPAQQ